MLNEPAIADCVVFGEGQPYCVALVSTREPVTDAEAVQAAMERVNARLPDYARVRRWYRLAGRLAANPEFFTPNGRPRRDVIHSRFQAPLAALYTNPEEAVTP
jgi:hypothetical protein